jgi:hypothetical protein
VLLPRITFGIIVLNGEPFTRYNLRALYPFAHEIIVVEGASPKASHAADGDGHSVDGTLNVLRAFVQREDPDGKVQVVTAEDDGHPNGFWPGEKDEQSQAYAKRATGDWLWQVDIDEFYPPDGIRQVCGYLCGHPDVACMTFNAVHFWGGFDYVLDGGLVRSRSFQGEPWGAYRRVFKWGPGYHYVSHRPPAVNDDAGRDLRRVVTRNLSRHVVPSVHLHHYTAVFPAQVVPKGAYYANQGWRVGVTQRDKFERFCSPLSFRRGLRIFDHYGTYNWLRRFRGCHPPAIEALRADLRSGRLAVTARSVDDIEALIVRPAYRAVTLLLSVLEWCRSAFHHARFAMGSLARGRRS